MSDTRAEPSARALVDELIQCCVEDTLITHATPDSKPHDPDPNIDRLRDELLQALSAPPALVWTTKVPTVPGKYWWKAKQQDTPEIMTVIAAFVTGQAITHCDYGYWAGPLEVPK